MSDPKRCDSKNSNSPDDQASGRMKLCSQGGGAARDLGFYLILVALALVSGWLLLMPWVPSIAESTMERFHLRSSSFAWWAVQQPIPAMYNFANRTEIRDLPPADHLVGLVDPFLLDPLATEATNASPADPSRRELGIVGGRMINHFPTREFTFANGRYRYLRGEDPRWFVLESRYRGSELSSTYELRPLPEGGWQVTLVADEQPEESSLPDGKGDLREW